MSRVLLPGGSDPHRRYAVIGASGFIGNAVAARLEWDGCAVARFTRQYPAVSPAGVLAPAVADADIIYWLISGIRPSDAGNAATDLRALDNLLAGLRRVGSTARVVVASSGGTAYDTDYSPPYAEDAPVNAANRYGTAMLYSERMLAQHWSNQVVLRVSNAYGPGQVARRGQGVIAYWLDSVARGLPITVIGNPAVRRDYVYITDLVAALLAAGRHPEPPPVLNIGSGHGTSLGELAMTIRELVGPRLQIEYAPARTFDGASTWLDTTLATDALGWQPIVPLAVGLRHSWRDTRRRQRDTGRAVGLGIAT